MADAPPGDPRAVTVAILGAGVAGLAAALSLAAIGVDVALFEREADPQRARPHEGHVHRLSPALWRSADALPGLEAALRAAGAGVGDVCIDGRVTGPANLLASRAEFSTALLARADAEPRIHRPAPARVAIEWRDARWQIRHPHGAWRADWLVDASGAHRASFGVVEAATGCELLSECFGGRQRYSTLRLAGPATDERRLHLLRLADADDLLIDEFPDGRLTVTHRQSRDCAPDRHPLADVLAAHGQPALAARLRRAQPVGEVIHHRAAACRRLVIGAFDHPGFNWCVLGDALLQTPPWQGQGVAFAIAQAQTLADAWLAYAQRPSPACAIRAALDGLSLRQQIASVLGSWAQGAPAPQRITESS